VVLPAGAPQRHSQIFYVLVFGTGHWTRLVPTTWSVFPNAASAALQYLSLDWPTSQDWLAYNSLQLLAYFVTVFVAAPLAFITGLGMSPALSTKFRRISSVLSIQVARSLHFLVLVWFLLFIVVHVTLVLTTEALRNFNMMYADRNDDSWQGFWIFAASLVVLTAVWVAATPVTYRHPRVVQRVGYALIGPVQRLFEHLDSKPGQYTEKDISPYLWHNGKYPATEEYADLSAHGFTDYRLQVSGLVDNPVELDLPQLRALPHHEQITQHFCIQGWSGVAKWGGVSMQTIVDLVRPQPEARWVVFYSFAEGPNGGVYYDVHPIEQMSYHLTMLAYDMNDATLPYGPMALPLGVGCSMARVTWMLGRSRHAGGAVARSGDHLLTRSCGGA